MKNQSTLIYQDGKRKKLPAWLAYQIWLAVPQVALRTAGDNRPVQPWDFGTAAKAAAKGVA